jgi:pyruvate kinase
LKSYRLSHDAVRHLHITLGPALGDDGLLVEALAAGATACRINLSHCRADDLGSVFGRLRTAFLTCGLELPIGADLRGRKLRIGALPGGAIELAVGSLFRLHPIAVDEEGPGSRDSASVNYPLLGAAARPGDAIALDDGLVRLRVERATADEVGCRVEQGGLLPERSGLAIPGRAIALPALTAKDLVDLDALSRLRPDFVYFSYCETAADIELLRTELARRGLVVPIVAKIERAVALDHLAELVVAADAICLARGDLGVELPLTGLLAAQRRVMAEARAASKPVLLAGEVLYSMVSCRSRPTRAEVTDVLVALEQGAAGFVLSDETAVGRWPVAAVSWLRAFIDAAGVGSS